MTSVSESPEKLVKVKYLTQRGVQLPTLQVLRFPYLELTCNLPRPH